MNKLTKLRLIIPAFLLAFALLNQYFGPVCRVYADTETSLVGTVFKDKSAKFKYEITRDADDDSNGEVTLVSNYSSVTTCAAISSTVVYQKKTYDVTAIGDRAFSFKQALLAVSIPDSVKSIGNAAFYDCEVLESVYIGSGTESIGTACFSYCNALKEIAVASDNAYYRTVRGLIYSKDYSLLVSSGAASDQIKISKKTVSIAPYAFEGNSSVTYVTCQAGLTTIGENAFFNCSALTGITLSKTVADISGNPFKYCTSLTEFTVSSKNKTFSASGNMLLSKAGKTLYSCPSASGAYTVAANVKYIKPFAFTGAMIESLTIPSTVKTISSGAFYNCQSLKKVVFNSRSTLLDIVEEYEEYGVFGNTTHYLEVSIPYSAEESFTEGSLEESVKASATSGVIVVNR